MNPYAFIGSFDVVTQSHVEAQQLGYLERCKDSEGFVQCESVDFISIESKQCKREDWPNVY